MYVGDGKVIILMQLNSSLYFFEKQDLSTKLRKTVNAEIQY
jgi:hypothetical protein